MTAPGVYDGIVRERPFPDREEAGRRLGAELERLELHDPVVLGLPRGGVPVAAEVARRLDAPLEVFVARKIGAPGHAELGVGAVAEGGEPVWDTDLLAALRLTPDDLAGTVAAEREEVARRVTAYRGERQLPDLAGRDVVVVDDGLATGGTARAALQALRARAPRRLVLAVPVAPPEAVRALEACADEVVAVLQPAGFRAVGTWYHRFDQLSDAEVVDILTGA